MMNWKRMTALLSALMILAIAAGCGGTKPAENPAPAPVAAATTPPPAPPVDKNAIVTEAVVSYFATMPAAWHMWEGKDLVEKVNAKDPSIFLLDIRRVEDFQKGHVAGSLNVPFVEVGANLAKLPKDKQLVVMCYSGQTSGQTIAALRMAGYNAVSLKGGFPSWEKAGGTLAK